MDTNIGPDTAINRSELLDLLQPQIIVVNGAVYRQPAQATEMTSRLRQHGANLLDIDTLGSIEMISDGQQMWWLEWGDCR